MHCYKRQHYSEGMIAEVVEMVNLIQFSQQSYYHKHNVRAMHYGIGHVCCRDSVQSTLNLSKLDEISVDS